MQISSHSPHTHGSSRNRLYQTCNLVLWLSRSPKATHELIYFGHVFSPFISHQRKRKHHSAPKRRTVSLRSNRRKWHFVHLLCANLLTISLTFKCAFDKRQFYGNCSALKRLMPNDEQPAAKKSTTQSILLGSWACVYRHFNTWWQLFRWKFFVWMMTKKYQRFQLND